MTTPATPPGRRERDPDWLGAALLVPPGVLLALLSSLGLVVGVGIAVAGAVGFFAVAQVRVARDHALPGVAAIAALGVLALTVPPLPIAGLLAGVGAVAVLLALGRSASPPAHRGRVWRGLGVPFFGFLVAFATAIVLPVSRQYVGVATLLVVIAVAALAMLFATPDRPDAAEPEAS